MMNTKLCLVWLTQGLVGSALFAVVSVQQQSQTTTNQAGVVRTEVVQQRATLEGALVPWRQDTIVSRPTQPGVTEATHEIRQRGAQGELRLEARQVSTTTQTPSGSTTQARQYRRDAAGKLNLSLVAQETVQNTPSGTVSTRLEQSPDINGNLVRQREVQTTITSSGPNTQSAEVRVRSFDPVAGEFRLTRVETTNTRQQGGQTLTETVARAPRNEAGPGPVVERTVTTSQLQPNGTLQRETIVYGQEQFARSGSATSTELVPQRKIVERVVEQANGTSQLVREVYRRDVNNDWQPVRILPSDELPAF